MRFILPAFLAVIHSLHAAQGPAESAVDFLKKLGSGPVDLAPTTDTAILSDISAAKKESIQQRLQRLSRELKGLEVQVGPVRTEGSLAGVILRTVDPANASEARVISLAMVQDNGVWRAAPVPASFENTSAHYSRSSREMARQLEAWLAREHAQELERIRQAADGLLRESLAKAISPETVRGWTEDQAVTAFLDACGKRDIPRILALLGGLSSPPPDGWQQAASHVRNAIATPAPKADPWTLLTAPAVVRSLPVVADSEGDQDQEYHILCLDPRNARESTFYRQNLVVSATSDGLWSVRPSSEPESLTADEVGKESDALFLENYPLKAQTAALDLKKALLASFGSDAADIYSCLHFLRRDSNPELDFPRFQSAVQMRWQTLNPLHVVIPRELGFLEDGDHAYLAVQWLSLARLTYSATVLHLQKSKDGWIWDSTPDMAQAAAAETWMKLNEAIWKKSYLTQTIEGCAQPDPALQAPTAAASSQVIQAWIDALSASDWPKALSFCAQLGTPKSAAELLRNLGYECKTARQAVAKPIHELVAQGKSVTLMVTRSTEKNNPILTLLPVVATAQGPRILLEIDLGDPARPGRAFLNRNALDRLKLAQPAMAEELKTMLSNLPAGK